MGPAAQSAGGHLDAVIDARSTVLRFPGPACIIDDSRSIMLANALWDAMMVAAGGDARLPGELAGCVLCAELSGHAQRTVATVEVAAGTVNLDVTCIPCQVMGRKSVLVLANDLRPLETLHGSLLTGRDRHFDLALCASDTTFETDALGRFTYVGPCGFLGYADFELHGTPVADLVAERSANLVSQVFESREAVWEAEIWFRALSGDAICLLISAMPLIDDEGQWLGLRGVGRDVTDQRVREEEIARVKSSQRRIDSVIHSMRAEADPLEMMRVGACAAIDTLGLDGCVVFSNGSGDGLHIVVRCGSAAADSGSDLAAIPDGALVNLAAAPTGAESSGAVEDRCADTMTLAIETRYAGLPNGALMFIRRSAEEAETESGWSADDKQLLRAIAGQVSVGLAQLDNEPPPAGPSQRTTRGGQRGSV